MDFKKAIFISVVSHCLFLAPLGSLGLFSPAKKTNEVQITYYKIKPPETKSAKPKKKKKATKRIKMVPVSVKETAVTKKKEPKTQTKPKIVPPTQKAVKITKKKKVPKSKPKSKRPIIQEKAIPESIPGTTLPNTPECISYYHYIREAIRRSLEKTYRPDHAEGEIVAAFVLNRNGRLRNLRGAGGRSSRDPFLRRLSMESIKRAAPFKSFPEGLELKEISFSLTVVFKKR